jgi:hypothetical protein
LGNILFIELLELSILIFYLYLFSFAKIGYGEKFVFKNPKLNAKCEGQITTISVVNVNNNVNNNNNNLNGISANANNNQNNNANVNNNAANIIIAMPGRKRRKRSDPL